MCGSMVLLPLKLKKLVNRTHRNRVAARDPHFPARGDDLGIADRAAARRHHPGPGNGLGMDREGLVKSPARNASSMSRRCARIVATARCRPGRRARARRGRHRGGPQKRARSCTGRRP